ncbi:glycosyltransferase family 9 protein [Phocaeicola sp.]
MKYLLCEAHGIGDCILVLPVAKSIKRYDKEAYIKVFTRSDKMKISINKSIMSLQNYVDEIEYYSSNEILHSLKFLFSNAIKRFDYGIVIQDYDSSNTSAIPSYIVRLCCKLTCGIKITMNNTIKYDYYIEREEGIRRDEYFYRALARLNIQVVKDETNLLDLSKVRKMIPSININRNNKTIVVIMGTALVSMKTKLGILTNDSKNWPYIKWLELIRLLDSNKFNILLLGGVKEEKELKVMKVQFASCNIWNFVGKCNIQQSIALLSLSDIVVGADTGLMHCAGALDKPSLTLFGCTDYREYLPFGVRSECIASTVECSPCFGTFKAVTCSEKKCMDMISVDQVYNRICEILKR